MPVPPKTVQDAAQSALDARSEVSPYLRAGTPVGIARARDLANGADVSTNTLERMYSYLMRAKFDYDAARKQGKTIKNSRAIMAYYLWGGPAALAWVRRELNK
jgi:hypothetical protein